MLQFTLDTCCIIDGAQHEMAWVQVDELVALAQSGAIELWLAAAFTPINGGRLMKSGWRIFSGSKIAP